MDAGPPISKCVVLARGLGTRMREYDSFAPIDLAQSAAADSGTKAMVPFAGRPFLDYALSALADAGFTRVCLVIAPGHNAVSDRYTQTFHPQRISLSFAVQPEALGTANAVLAAEPFAGSDEFLVMNSDNYYPLDVLQQMQQLGQPGAVLFDAEALVRYSNISEERIRAFAFCVVDSHGFLADIIEKPAATTVNTAKLVSMNCWRFGPDIFSVCRDVPLSPRGEYELPLAVKLGIQRGMKLKTVISRSGVLDLSRRSDIAAVAERLKHTEVAL